MTVSMSYLRVIEPNQCQKLRTVPPVHYRHSMFPFRVAHSRSLSNRPLGSQEPAQPLQWQDAYKRADDSKILFFMLIFVVDSISFPDFCEAHFLSTKICMTCVANQAKCCHVNISSAMFRPINNPLKISFS